MAHRSHQEPAIISCIPMCLKGSPCQASHGRGFKVYELNPQVAQLQLSDRCPSREDPPTCPRQNSSWRPQLQLPDNWPLRDNVPTDPSKGYGGKGKDCGGKGGKGPAQILDYGECRHTVFISGFDSHLGEKELAWHFKNFTFFHISRCEKFPGAARKI